MAMYAAPPTSVTTLLFVDMSAVGVALALNVRKKDGSHGWAANVPLTAVIGDTPSDNRVGVTVYVYAVE